MDFNLYQMLAWRTRNTALDDQTHLTVLAVKMAGEVGEVCELIGKHLGHGHPLDREKVKKELGDVLWYIACMARHLGIDLDDVAEANIVKLKERYPNGFSTAASINRVEEKP